MDGEVGGIVGINNGEIINCMSNVAINNTNSDTSDGLDLKSTSGGIAGINNGNISNCCNIGKIEGHIDLDYAIIGGIAGKSYGKIINCYNIGEMKETGIVREILNYEERVQMVQQEIFPWMEIDTVRKFIEFGVNGLNDNEKDTMYEYMTTKTEGENEEIIRTYIYGSKEEILEVFGDLIGIVIPNIYAQEGIENGATLMYIDIEGRAMGYIISNKVGGIVGIGEGTVQNCYNTVNTDGGIIGRVTGNTTIDNCGYLSGTAERGVFAVDNGTVTGEAQALTTMPNLLEILNAGQEDIWILDENGKPTLKN